MSVWYRIFVKLNGFVKLYIGRIKVYFCKLYIIGLVNGDFCLSNIIVGVVKVSYFGRGKYL